MARTGGHWSRRAALRTLDALMRLGGRGTTFQVQQITRSLAVHQDIFSVRCWLQFEHGYDETDTHLAVLRENLGKNPDDRQVVLYTLREDVKVIHRLRRLRREQNNRSHRGAARNTPAQTREQSACASPVVPSVSSAQSADSGAVSAQSTLFETEDALSLRRKADQHR